MNIQATPVFHKLKTAFESKQFSVFVLEGGSRSSKTHSIIQFWILWAQLNQGSLKRVVVSRQKGTWLFTTVMQDFISILKAYGLYDEKCYNKTNRVYRLFDTEFWFIGLDDPQKLHGLSSDAFWINEAIEASKEDFDQLEMRCKGFSILDYNPSVDTHWIYNNVCLRPETKFIHSTMLDNPFLPENSRRKILSYKPTDENFAAGTADKNKWEIYGLGLRAKLEGVIYEKWDIVKEMPLVGKTRRYGMDFGYTNDVTAIVDVYWSGNHIFVDEVCYQTHLLNTEIGKIIKANNLQHVKGYGDSAEPKSIDELHKMGINIHPVRKGAGSIKNGIDILKRYQLHFTERSVNLIKEVRNYKWRQDKNGRWLNEPIDDWCHGLDALRYVALMELDYKAKGIGLAALSCLR
jgi:phage terminase large subunit